MSTGIPYCNEVLEVSGGCTKCETGCTNCWAIKEVWRMAHNPKLGDKWQGLVEKTASGLNWTGRIKLFEGVLSRRLPGKDKTYFIDSKADLFHPSVPFEFIKKVWDMMMYDAPQHSYQILTKRCQRMFTFVKDNPYDSENIHLGVSISTQKEADEKIPIFLQILAAVRVVSLEPMLEAIDLTRTPTTEREMREDLARNGHTAEQIDIKFMPRIDGKIEFTGLTKLNQVIIGCESINGRAGRFQDGFINAATNTVYQCKAANVPVFVKQICSSGKVVRDIKQFPKDLRLQEYPK